LRSITTDVSSKPLSVSATRIDVLIYAAVEVRAQPLIIEVRRATERRRQCRAVHDATAPQWEEFSDGDTVAGDDECLALVESTHDVTAVVA